MLLTLVKECTIQELLAGDGLVLVIQDQEFQRKSTEKGPIFLMNQLNFQAKIWWLLKKLNEKKYLEKIFFPLHSLIDINQALISSSCIFHIEIEIYYLTFLEEPSMFYSAAVDRFQLFLIIYRIGQLIEVIFKWD